MIQVADAGRYFPQLLYYINIPAHRNAKLYKSPHSSKRWPVLIFSHGLGGSRNGYSHLCGSLAAHGLIVIATDHRDGSEPVSHIRAVGDEPAREIDYENFGHTPCAETFEGRDEQLKIRIWEMCCIMEAIRRVDLGEEVTNLDPNIEDATRESWDVLGKFKDRLDIQRPGSICFAGHSFGATTTIQFLKSVYYTRYKISSPLMVADPSRELVKQITSTTPTILLDLWALPLNSPDTASLKAQPMPAFYPPTAPGGSNLLAVLSEAFFNWPTNYTDVQRALTDPFANPAAENSEQTSRMPRSAAHIFYPLTSAHLSQSDFGVLFPWIMKMMSTAAEPTRTLKLNVRAILQVLRQAGVPVAKTSAEDRELSEEEAQAGEDDWQILSTKEDAVRGWVALRTDEHRKAVKNKTQPNRPKITPRMSSFGADELRGALEEGDDSSDG